MIHEFNPLSDDFTDECAAAISNDEFRRIAAPHPSFNSDFFVPWKIRAAISALDVFASASLDKDMPKRVRETPMSASYSGVINAVTFPSPTRKPVIVFDMGADLLLHYFISSIMLCIPRGGSPRPDINPIAMGVIHNSLNFILKRDFSYFARAAVWQHQVARMLGEDGLHVAFEISGLASDFVIHHELGHAVLNHLNRAETLRLSMQQGEIGVMVGNFEVEYEADVFAAAQFGAAPALYWSGCAMIFAILAYAETFKGHPIGRTHPAWSARWERLKPMVPRDLRPVIFHLHDSASYICAVHSELSDEALSLLETIPSELAQF